MNILTHKQEKVLDTLASYITKEGQSPTLEELRSLLGFRSLRTVVQYLEVLERKGCILRHKNVARNIELLNTHSPLNQTVSVPIVASVGCDDLSVFENQESDEYLEVDKKYVDSVGDIVGVRAVGDSMNDAGIESGDYILVQFTDRAENGDRVAAMVNGMVTVKRFERQDGVIILRPESKDPKYKPIILSGDFKIIGKVLCVIQSPLAHMTEVVPLEGAVFA